MPRKWHEFAGGTWTTVDPVANYNALVANTAADAVQDTKLDLKAAAMSGDMVLVCTPATLGTAASAVVAAVAAAGNKYTRTVAVTLETAAGERHTWYSGTHDAAAVPTTNGNGTCALAAAATTITFVNGLATATIDYTLTWAADDVCTFTVVDGEIMGKAVGDATSVDTLV
jgi:hypothetical protein